MTWIWFLTENDHIKVEGIEKEPFFLEIGNRIVLENIQSNAIETITIKGDDAGLEEGILALRKGAVVTEMNLVYKVSDQKWQFTIKGESFNMSSLNLPHTGRIESQKDREGAVIEKVYLYEKIFQLIDNLFKQFIILRVSNDWGKNVVPQIRQWIYS
ncbi:MAG: hypothetical protein SWO11_00105 [Thermodesulfobacteriota bacterium]|nr:hypothetical protein [Thermodesulfobacteriota bacterium]